MTISRNLSILAEGASSSGVLAVTNGGTGVTTSTGSGNNVLSASPTFSGTISFPGSTTVDSSGNLGVGTTSPGSKLDVQAATNAYARVKTSSSGYALFDIDAASANQPILRFLANGTESARIVSPVNEAANQLTFCTGTGSTERMRIDSSGNVGIGTSSPSAKLQVQGSQASGTANVLYLDNSSVTGTTLASVSFSNAGNVKASIAACVAGDGYMTFNNNNNSEKMRLDASGNLLIGRTSLVTPSGLSGGNVQASLGFSAYNGTNAAQYVVDRINFNASNFYVINASSTGVVLVSGNTSWSAQSDERLKDIIEPIADAVDKVSTLRAVIGRYKADDDSKRRAFLMAQDVQAVLPEAVSEDADGHLLLGYSETIPLLVAAIKELSAKNDALEARLAALETP